MGQQKRHSCATSAGGNSAPIHIANNNTMSICNNTTPYSENWSLTLNIYPAFSGKTVIHS